MPLGLDKLLVHGHIVVPTGGFMDQWFWNSRFHPVEWYGFGDGWFCQAVFWMMVNGYWSIWIGRCDLLDFSDHPLELGGPGPLLSLGYLHHHLWILSAA